MASIYEHRQAAPGFVPRDPTASNGAAPARARSLSRLVECEIIPRLMNVGQPPARTQATRAFAADEIAAFARAALEVEADALITTARAMLDTRTTPTTLLVDLLGPTARLLGEYWKQDRCDFVEVTMALWRLQEVVHELALLAPPPRGVFGGRRRALFAAMPGDQHGFGALVVAEVFAREGWAVTRPIDPTTRALVAQVADEWFEIVGLTVSCDCHTGALPSLIASLRSVSRNPSLRVMVGGRVFVEQPALAETVGADGTAADARLALALADALAPREAVLG